MADDTIIRGAELDAARVHRFRLWREWDPLLPRMMVIGLNPSTADEQDDDPTILVCMGFARRWGHGALDMGNLFALRSTDPKALAAHDDPTGDPLNLDKLRHTASIASRILLAWGDGERLRAGRAARVLVALDGERAKMCCLGRTKKGAPLHPLRQRADTQPQPFFGGA